MNYLNPQLCKVDNTCQHVVPIAYEESIGNSLSSINLNFRSLDIQTCNLEYSAVNYWNSAWNAFQQLSATWTSSQQTVATLSSCWQQTWTTVSQSSAFWLKPVTIIYPFPFDSSNSDQISQNITSWLNENFPIRNGNCFNFIVGQELYIFTPEYNQINRFLSKTVNQGIKTVGVNCFCSCIKRGTYSYVNYGNVDCGSITATIDVPDQYVDRFVGFKFVIDPINLVWVQDSILFN
jgi:hypothetical protein